MKYVLKGLGTAVLLVLSFSQANAQLVNFTLEGSVNHTYVDWFYGPNIFGLNVGDAVTATSTFDDSLISASGWSTIYFDDPSLGLDLTVEVGTGTYGNAEEYFGGAWLHFYNGQFDGLSYSATDWEFDSMNFWFDGSGFEGSWNNATIAPAVPVPAAVWLFGSGLLGLVGMARRKNKGV